jgi:TonB family protein
MGKMSGLLAVVAVLWIPVAQAAGRNGLPIDDRAVVMDASGGQVHGGRVIRRIAPLYPVGARNAEVSGTVKVEAWIGKDGKVVDSQVLSGPVLLRKAAQSAVRRWQYEPTILDGKAIDRIAKVEVEFLPSTR